MKSLTAVCQTGGAAMPAINASGRISRPAHQRGDGENAEMKMYLSKLKDLVPFMPKNRKLSKLEIIQHVIDYICDLQTELETHPDVNNFDAASALNNYAAAAAAVQAADVNHQVILSQRLNASEQQQQQQYNASPANLTNINTTTTNTVIRQPLVDRQTPNTILSTPAVATPTTTIITTTATTTPTAQQQSQTATTSASSLPSAAEKESKSGRLSSTAVNLY